MTHGHGENLEDIAKKSLKMLIAEHKRNCKNSNCNVSLILIRIWLEKFGIKFTKEEKRLFS